MAAAKKVEGGKPAVHERLRRLLLLVPYVVKHPGVEVAELAGALGLSREELLEELDFLSLVGRPPFQPGDYIDLHVDDDRVYVDLDQRFSAPPRLTANEAVALAASATLLRPEANEPLASALTKLERVLPAGVRERYREMWKGLDVAGDGPAELGPLSRAILERREVEFDYFAFGRGSTEARRVQPHELRSHRGQWYLSGHCLTRKDVRLFRLDRVRNLVVTERSFTSESSASSGAIRPVSSGQEVVVRFSAQAAPYVRERFGELARPLEGGGVEVAVAGDSERWLTQWLLSFGGEAQVVSPEWARQAVARAAKASLES